MNAQLSMENIGDLHGVSHEQVSATAELMSRQPSSQDHGDPSQQPLVSPRPIHGHGVNPRQRRLSSPSTHGSRSGRPPAPGDVHGLRGSSGHGHEHEQHLHHANPLQPLPPISTVSDKFPITTTTTTTIIITPTSGSPAT
ncbi:hypothetical protein COCON_G00112560 [Conger conger]|uniref:Uncharacterized protein n=1 Tax=Conger conger TaxID=82655 RepID=A0A9Q1I0C6_CONCO|nr:hypothetical protein COCON_G00112560 [Conger conger]